MHPPGVDPIIAKFARGETARREWERLSNFVPDSDHPEMISLDQESYDLLNEIIATKADTIDGLRCQIILMWEYYGPSLLTPKAEERAQPDLRLQRQILLGIEDLCCAPSWQQIDPRMMPHSLF